MLILCTGNSARSQMAEGLLRDMAAARFDVCSLFRSGSDITRLSRDMAATRFDVCSAGTKPSSVRPEAIRVLGELGIDISGQKSKAVDGFLGQSFDYVITVCDNAKDSCPVFPGPARRIHWSLEDPAAVDGSEAERLGVFRNVRDQIRRKLAEFVS